MVFEELLHIAALSHLSTSIKRELSSIIVFESHNQAGTIRKCDTTTFIILVHFFMILYSQGDSIMCVMFLIHSLQSRR